MRWSYLLMFCLVAQPASACLTPGQIFADTMGATPWAMRLRTDFNEELGLLRKVEPHVAAAVVASFDRIVERGQPSMLGVKMMAERGGCSYRIELKVGSLVIEPLGPWTSP